MLVAILFLLCLGGLGGVSVDAWGVYNIEHYGAISGCKDCTASIHATLAAARSENPNGAEVLIPKHGVYISSPINITSNIILRVNGNLTAIRDESKFPNVELLPSYGYDLDLGRFGHSGGGNHGTKLRKHPFIWSVNATNVTICGSGTIDGSGYYWIQKYHNKSLAMHSGWPGRPHLIEIMYGKDVTIAGTPKLTLLNSGFWTLHPIYTNNIHIHNIDIIASNCTVWDNEACGLNIDGIDVDSSQNVIIENNYIAVGDDHVTVLSGGGQAGRLYNAPSRNVTVKNNILGHGMGLSIGSSVSGGVEDVLYVNNTMSETRGQWGQGIHIKTRIGIGGYIKNVIWDSNIFYSTGLAAILIEAGYQSDGTCDATNCTRIEDIVLRNLTFHNSSSPGRILCPEEQPCSNITLDNVKVNGGNQWFDCENVLDSTFTNVLPTGLKELCEKHSKSDNGPVNPSKKNDIIKTDQNGGSVNKGLVFVCIFFSGVAIGFLIYCCFKYDIRIGWNRVRQYCCAGSSEEEGREPLLDTVIFEPSIVV